MKHQNNLLCCADLTYQPCTDCCRPCLIRSRLGLNTPSSKAQESSEVDDADLAVCQLYRCHCLLDDIALLLNDHSEKEPNSIGIWLLLQFLLIKHTYLGIIRVRWMR